MSAEVRTTIQTVDAPAAPEPEAAAPEAPAPTEAAPAPAAPEPPKSEPDRDLDVAKRLDAIAKKEARARRVEVELQTLRSEIEEKSKRLDERLAEMDEFESDPISYYIKKGKDPVAVARRFAQPETEEAKRIRKLEEKLAADAEERKKAGEFEESTKKSAAKHAALRAFVGSIVPDDCPNLTTLYEADEVPALLEELLHRTVRVERGRRVTTLEDFQEKYGRGPTDAELRETLEYEAGLRANRLLAKQVKPADAGEAQPPEVSNGATPGPSSISNQHAAPTSTAKSTRPLTLEEKRREAKKRITAQLEAEAATRSE